MKIGAPRDHNLPFDEWRPGQLLAIRTALAAKTVHTVIQSPTGSGKSTIGGALVTLHDGRTEILTATKGLEDQYSDTLPFLCDVRGLSNYECLAARDVFKDLFMYRKRRSPVMCDEGPCRSHVACDLKENGCLYFDAYREALASPAPLTNYSYHIAMRRFSKGLGPVDRLILDEAHALPEELMGNCRLEIPVHLVKGNPPKSHAGWKRWALSQLQHMKPKGDQPESMKVQRQKTVDSLEQLSQIDDTWAWDIYGPHVVFEPTIPRLLLPLLYDAASAPKLVYLSATITPLTLKMLGIANEDVTFQVMKSRFPVANRPVYIVESTRVDHRMSDIDKEYWISRHDKIIKHRLDRRGIIHPVSYQRALDIQAASKYGKYMIVPRSSRELPAALHYYLTTKPPVILVSPAIMTGYNFPYEACEYQILSKVPFPDTRSAIMRARIKATDNYRDHLTMNAVNQAVGRPVRADDDRAETFIVDDHIRWYLRQAWDLGLVPQSLSDALQFVAQPPLPPPPLHHSRKLSLVSLKT